MDWKTLLACITGSVEEHILLRNEYLAAENTIFRNQIKGRLHLSDAERITLAEIGQKSGKQALEEVAKAAKKANILAEDMRGVVNNLRSRSEALRTTSNEFLATLRRGSAASSGARRTRPPGP